MHEAWAEVEDYLERIADLQGMQLHRVVALPEWRDRLTVRMYPSASTQTAAWAQSSSIHSTECGVEMKALLVSLLSAFHSSTTGTTSTATRAMATAMNVVRTVRAPADSPSVVRVIS